MNNKAKEFGFQSFVLVITRQKHWKRPFNPYCAVGKSEMLF